MADKLISYTPRDLGIDVPAGPVPLSLREQMEDALDAIIPPGHTTAVIGNVTLDSGKIAFAARLGDHWKIESDIEKRWHGDLTFRAQVMWSR